MEFLNIDGRPFPALFLASKSTFLFNKQKEELMEFYEVVKNQIDKKDSYK